MPDIYMDVDIAIAEAPVNVMPLIDDTDFKSIEDAVAYNAAGMALIWHFVTTAGVMTETAVTPTTAGVHDWTDQGTSGLYALEIPASGGTINNDTEGFGWFTGVATGVLPWRGPVIGFRAAALNNSLVDAGTTGLLAPTVAARTLDVTATGAAGIDWGNVENKTTSNNLSGTTTNLVNTCTTNTDMRGTDSALLAASTPANFGDLAITVTTGRVTVGTNNDKAGYSISGTKTTLDALNDIAATAIVSGGAITTSGGAVSNVTLVATTTTNTDMRGTDSAATATALATVDTVVDAIKAKTDSLTFTNAGEVDANAKSMNDATILGIGTSGDLWRG